MHLIDTTGDSWEICTFPETKWDILGCLNKAQCRCQYCQRTAYSNPVYCKENSNIWDTVQNSLFFPNQLLNPTWMFCNTDFYCGDFCFLLEYWEVKLLFFVTVFKVGDSIKLAEALLSDLAGFQTFRQSADCFLEQLKVYEQEQFDDWSRNIQSELSNPKSGLW